MAAYEARGESDEWYTPKYIFEALGDRFGLDVAAPVGGLRHVPCKEWYAEDSLERLWFGYVWMNPPFGHQAEKRRWLKKFFDHGHGIALMPDRTSAPWFQEFAPEAAALLWMSPKVKFERPDGTVCKSPGIGTVLMAAVSRAAAALLRARMLGMATFPIQIEQAG